jgi:hypothetical protein
MLENPKGGESVVVLAGAEPVEIAFDVVNDSPDPAAFQVDAEGLPGGDWTSGTGSAAAIGLGSEERGRVIVRVRPPASAPAGRHTLRLKVLVNGVAYQAPVDLAVTVTASATPPPTPVVPLPVPPPSVPAAPVLPAPVPRVPVTPPAPPPSAPVPPPAPVPRPVVVPEAAPPPPAPVVVAAVVEEAAPPPPPPVREETVDDPRSGAVFALRPGETLVLRFPIHNTGKSESTHSLAPDGSLKIGWFTLLQAQINLTANGKGELTLRLNPPLGARAGDYSFSLSLGQYGGTLEERHYVLSVQAAPAVKLTAHRTHVTAGLFGDSADFNLTVQGSGNADTAFRIAVVGGNNGTSAPLSSDGTPVYATAPWRYLIDREVDTARANQNEAVRVRVQRQGTWWFGVQEAHTVRVAAVPVTDPGNGGQGENEVVLTAKHWRIHPIHERILIPLAILALVVWLGGAKELTIVNGYSSSITDGPQYYVFGKDGDKEIRVKLRWKGLIFASIVTNVPDRPRLNGWFWKLEDAFPVTGDKLYGGSRTFALSRKDTLVRFLPARTAGNLRVLLNGRPVQGTPSQEKVGEDTLKTASYDIPVAHGRYASITFEDTRPDTQIRLYLVRDVFNGSVFDKSFKEIEWTANPGIRTYPIKLKPRDDAKAGSTDTVVLATTDGAAQLVTLNLKVQ